MQMKTIGKERMTTAPWRDVKSPWHMRKENVFLLTALLFLLVVNCVAGIMPTTAHWTDSETIIVKCAMGEPGGPVISCLEPDWGVCGVRGWVVGVSGSGFAGDCALRLYRDGVVIEALKIKAFAPDYLYSYFDLSGAQAGWYDVHLVADGRKAVLERGFLMKSPCDYPPAVLWEGGLDGNGLVLEKSADINDPNVITITIRGDLPGSMATARLLAPGAVVHGELTGGSVLRFDMNGTPDVEHDLLVTGTDGWNLIVERAIVPGDRRLPLELAAVEPSTIQTGGPVDLRIFCRNIPDEIEFTLKKGSFESKATRMVRVDGATVLCRFDLRAAPAGTYDLVAAHPSGAKVLLGACLKVCASTVGPTAPPAGKTPQQPSTPQGDVPAQEPPAPSDEQPEEGFSISPSSGDRGRAVKVLVRGGTFEGMLQARLKTDSVQAYSLECDFPQPSRLECTFNLYGIPEGRYRLEIIDYQGRLIYFAGYFHVTEKGG